MKINKTFLYNKCNNETQERIDEFTVEELKTMYRVITGACRAGTDNFVNSLGKLKEKYSVREVIELTKGQYNAKIFERFFTR